MSPRRTAPATTQVAGAGAVSHAESVAAAVLTVADVLALSAGPVGQFRSYLPGGSSVPGVRLDDDLLTINIVCRYGPALPELGNAIVVALGDLRGDRAVVVNVDDIVLPGEPEPDRAESLVDAASGPATGSSRPLGDD